MAFPRLSKVFCYSTEPDGSIRYRGFSLADPGSEVVVALASSPIFETTSGERTMHYGLDKEALRTAVEAK